MFFEGGNALPSWVLSASDPTMIWLRQFRVDGPQLSRLVGVGLTVSTVLAWLLWVSGLHAGFWSVIIITMLPLVVSMVHDIIPPAELCFDFDPGNSSVPGCLMRRTSSCIAWKCCDGLPNAGKKGPTFALSMALGLLGLPCERRADAASNMRDIFIINHFVSAIWSPVKAALRRRAGCSPSALSPDTKLTAAPNAKT